VKKIAARIAVVFTALLMSFAIAGPAMAADNEMKTDDGDPGGRVQVSWYGDIVTICDIEADGWGVYLSVTDVSQNLFKYSFWVGGNGNCTTNRASEGGTHDLREQNYFEFKICLRKADEGGVNLSYCDYSTWKNYQ